jgi:hypothetical protein
MMMMMDVVVDDDEAAVEMQRKLASGTLWFN